MDTVTNMKVVGAEMQHIEALKALLEGMIGHEPSIEARLDIMDGETRTTITVNDTEIAIREEPGGRIVAQGDWALARAALAGMPQQTTPDPPLNPEPPPSE